MNHSDGFAREPADTRQGGEVRLFSLCYVSRALVSSVKGSVVVGNIVEVSRERNARLNVTGALLFSGAHFAQVLEGTRDAVKELMASIERDERHTDISVVREGPVEFRDYGSWSLAYAGPSHFVDRYIRRASDTGPAAISRLLRLMKEYTT